MEIDLSLLFIIFNTFSSIYNTSIIIINSLCTCPCRLKTGSPLASMWRIEPLERTIRYSILWVFPSTRVLLKVFSQTSGKTEEFYEAKLDIVDGENVRSGSNPFYGMWYELDARFPDYSLAQIGIYEKTSFGGDVLVGQTVLDLEDRWFNKTWQQMKAKRRFAKEFRPLYGVNSDENVPKGKLEMWCEMYTPHECQQAVITDIRIPPEEEYELRVVIWESQNVPPVEGSNSISMYVTGEVNYKQGDSFTPVQYCSTDTHYWVKAGNAGLFNWRMKFNLSSPCKFPRLTLKVWSTDFITVYPSNAVGVATIDLDFLLALAASSNEDKIERQRTLVKLTQDAGSADRGDLDIQLTICKKRYAEANMVGLGREDPNKDPFLPEPKRETWFNLFGGGMTWTKLCIIFFLIAIPAAVIGIICYALLIR